LKQSKKLKTAT